jgi:uncharacterized protein (DUF302 family)
MEDQMTDESGFEVRVAASQDEAIVRVTGALKAEGFGVLTRIDSDQAFRDKIGAEFRPYTILGACNPQLAHTALTSNPATGLMLPCNVTVEATANHGSLVRIINPAIMMQMGELGLDEKVATVADDATRRLRPRPPEWAWRVPSYAIRRYRSLLDDRAGCGILVSGPRE